MAAELKRLAEEFRRRGFFIMEDYLRIGAQIARGLGAPESFSKPVKETTGQVETIKIYPEISLAKEWQRQAENLARLFAQELGFKTPEEYMATLPGFEPQLKTYRGRLDTPVIVETRISPRRQCVLAGIQDFFGASDTMDWPEDPRRYRTPGTPYVVWLEDGRHNLNKKPEDVRRKLKGDERCGTEFDGIALYVSNPGILKHHFLDLPGTSVGSGGAASLYLWRGRPELSGRFVGGASPGFGSVVCGRQK